MAENLISTIESGELESRFNAVITELDSIFKELGPKIQKVGQLREEAGILYEELKRRGLVKDAEQSVLQGQVSKT